MSPTITASALPTYLELIPEELDLRVYRHAIDTLDGPVPCWSYVSDGLRRHGQKEIVFTLRRRNGEADDAFPRDPIDYYLLLYKQASEGKQFDVGGYSRFARPSGFLGKEGPVGMTYITAPNYRGVNYPDKALAAVLLAAEEIDTIKLHGNYRLLSLLGFRSNHFPYPSWSERNRQVLLTARDARHSLLGKVPLASVPGLMTRRRRNQLYLHMEERAWSVLRKRLDQLPAEGPLALLTDPDPDAKARLVWKPGMEVETYGPDGRPDATLTGGFIAFIVADGIEEGAHVCEDGFAVKLTPPRWLEVKQAMLDGGTTSVAGHGGGMKFLVGLDAENEPVRQIGGHFFMSDAILRQRINGVELSHFDQKIVHAVEDHFCELNLEEGMAVTLVCAIRPGPETKFWLDTEPDELPQSMRTVLLRRLATLKPPKVTSPVAWAMHFEMFGGTGQRRDYLYVPREWQKLVPPGQRLAVPDEILSKVWPE